MTEEEALHKKRLSILKDLLYRAIPISNGVIVSRNNDPAREFTNKVLLWKIGLEKAEEIIKDYLERHGMEYHSNDAIRFILSAER